MSTIGKRRVDSINGTPEKRIFRSIIADYNLATGICELIDNAIDNWTSKERKSSLKIELWLDSSRQLIKIRDNAGGVAEEDLQLLVAPGASRDKSSAALIGIFGVGGKRAGVALGELVEIRTRCNAGKTFQIDINSDWIGSEDWNIDYFEVSNIPQKSTEIEISKLRQTFDDQDIEHLIKHFSETYSWYIDNGCTIEVNGGDLSGVKFNKWAYPAGFAPREAVFQVEPADGFKLDVTIVAGLIYDRDPELENYGVYFYCNDRLIVKELKTRDVGYFVTTEAGVPHPDASISRVIVNIRGSAEVMPWNSSKSDINLSHPAFSMMRSNIIILNSYYTKLSRKLKKEWAEQVFPFTTGVIETIPPSEIKKHKKIVLPKLPTNRRKSYLEKIKEINRSIISKRPWTLGLIESMAVSVATESMKIETRNRIALIILDSNIEISLKEFISHEVKLYPPYKYNDSFLVNLFKNRTNVINEIVAHVPQIDAVMIGKIQHYYSLRNKMIHERATVSVTDSDIENYRKIVQKVLALLHKIKFPS